MVVDADSIDQRKKKVPRARIMSIPKFIRILQLQLRQTVEILQPIKKITATSLSSQKDLVERKMKLEAELKEINRELDS